MTIDFLLTVALLIFIKEVRLATSLTFIMEVMLAMLVTLTKLRRLVMLAGGVKLAGIFWTTVTLTTVAGILVGAAMKKSIVILGIT